MKWLYFFLLMIAMSTFSSAIAQDHSSNNVLDKRLIFFGGMQRYEAKGEFSSTKEGLPKVQLDLDDLDLEENEITPILGLHYKMSKRWNLRLDYYGYHENQKKPPISISIMKI